MTTVAQKMTIGLAGSFTVDPLTRHLGKALEQKGFNGAEFAIAPYNQLSQLSFNPENLLGAPTDTLIILWRLEDIISDFQNAQNELENFICTLKTLRENYSGALIVGTPPYPNTPAFEPHDLQQPQTTGLLYHNLLQKFLAEIQNIDSVTLLNFSGLIDALGQDNAYDARKYYLYKNPYAEQVWKDTATQIARIISAQTTPAKKAIILDCDNTLWGGIIGEDGMSGIEIGSDFPGSAFQDFQKHLIHLRAKGLFLGIASKNNEADVLEVFDHHDGMALKRDHISAWQVHWNSKVDSIKAIAEELNIGTDALVFIDDNPKEIAEVQERLPEVTCLLVPEETAYLPDILKNTGLFDIAEMTEEDSKRADMMLAETKRKSVDHKSMSEEEFIKSLALNINVFEAQEQHLGRITQLINKTNQFNLTTIRRDKTEVEKLHADKDTLLMGMNISDRFGDYGLVGVAIIHKQASDVWEIDSLMMSCRVLGRHAETSFLAKIADAIEQHGGEILEGTYVKTPKNALVKDLYKNHGFNAKADKWIIKTTDIKQPSSDVTLSLELA